MSTIIKPGICATDSEVFIPMKQVKLTGIEDIKKQANAMIDNTGQKWTCNICGTPATFVERNTCPYRN